LVKVEDAEGLKAALEKATGIKQVVKKKREIYYIGNVKFHIDEVEGLGHFMEIEAGNVLINKTKEELQQQCNFYLKEFGIKEEDFIAVSYSDMLPEKN
jgi:adenylate cyclase, class 2